MMKRVKGFGIIALIAVIVLVAAGCGNPAGNDDKSNNGSETGNGGETGGGETGNENPPPASIESGNVGTLLRIAAGTFTMGSPEDEPERSDNEIQHSVTLTKDFYMGKYEVTQEQWEAVMGNNPSYSTGENLPVEYVSWYDAILFCNRLSVKENLRPAYSVKVSGTEIDWATAIAPTSVNADWNAAVCNWNADGYRLPTEGEWEYACRAGTTTAYSFGDNTADLANYAWYNGNSDYKTHDVGQLKANPWGLYDMHGNVEEWCWDCYGNYSSDAQTDPAGASSGIVRVVRDGGCVYSAQWLRSASRSGGTPTARDSRLGFRLVRPSA